MSDGACYTIDDVMRLTGVESRGDCEPSCYQRVHQEPWRPPAERPLAITTVLRTMPRNSDHAFEPGATPAVLLAPSMKFYGFPLEALAESLAPPRATPPCQI